MRAIMTDKEKEKFLIETNKPFNLCRNMNAKYILLNANGVNKKPNLIPCSHTLDRFARFDLINNIIEEKDIPQSIKDKLKNLGITE